LGKFGIYGGLGIRELESRETREQLKTCGIHIGAYTAVY